MWLLITAAAALCLYTPGKDEPLLEYPDASEVAVGGALMVHRTPEEVVAFEKRVEAFLRKSIDNSDMSRL
ncbi:hypothetical protein SARC_02183 [Sphaeroforma arctica JP610]|uniref:Uncharacterized protein n=1 Tax=Sphaeroforma arctica JP610 TaxID=667725 RepID=A0A0L0G9G8_9EUKA|nr:hypothetical protein SARC_02183 [Sphaeroforma arctica JP610]KNC85662.1 hypothetical protein SARC_02183 [Sphaeroforma arctica JP610]|eukprot:XP_014159564.1 hypothetical protein SARC_02183 [Sphaeroforma arctica JP610]